MKRSYCIVICAFAVLSTAAILTKRVTAGQADAIVRLQSTSPGVQQTGNGNLNGTMKAGQFQGGGAGITGINASNISTGTLGAARLPVPLSLTGSIGGGLITGNNGDPMGTGVAGVATAGSGSSSGLWGQCASTDGRGVTAWATASTGATNALWAQADSTGGRAITAFAPASTGSTFGIWAQSNSSAGTGVYGFAGDAFGNTKGVHGAANSTNGIGVYGTGRYGVYGTGFYAVYGYSTTGYGVYGSSTSASSAVKGDASLSGSRGVYGTALTYGVYGDTYFGGSGTYGLYANGNTGASGNKSFRIDHPLDPLHKYLLHYSAEGPEPQNIYNGTVTTDKNGAAWVELPGYFDEINKQPRYQLTVVDDSASLGFVQVKVARKIRDNRFLIMTSSPNIEVCWEVKAVRNDLWNRKYGAPVEVEKPERERGKYQHPELYGAPVTMKMN